MHLKKNIGAQGRLLRLVIAIILLVLAYVEASWILLIAGAFTLFEAAFSWCVVYQLLGKNSCPKSWCVVYQLLGKNSCPKE